MSRRTVTQQIGVTLSLAALAACGTSHKSAATPSSASVSSTASANAPVSATASNQPASAIPTQPATTSSPASVTASGGAYATKSFTLPFDVHVPTWLPTTPTTDESNFVTWEIPTSDRAVRFMIPVSVFVPGAAVATTPPRNYLAYLMGQTAAGGHFTDVSHVTVGGKPATLMTATSTASVDGSIGCQRPNMAAGDCFGLQPDLALRIAVVDLGTSTFLAWARANATSADNAAEFTDFEAMLRSLQFRK